MTNIIFLMKYHTCYLDITLQNKSRMNRVFNQDIPITKESPLESISLYNGSCQQVTLKHINPILYENY